MNAIGAVLFIWLALAGPNRLAIARPADELTDKVPVGVLTVYTGTKSYNSGNILYFPHTTYAIYHENGNFYRYVKNRTTPTDETPYTILIPAGRYFILAQSEKQGRVKFPIAIDPGRIATIRLDDPNRKRIPRDSQEIRIKNGSVAGWHWSRRAPQKYFERGVLIDLFGWKIQ